MVVFCKIYDIQIYFGIYIEINLIVNKFYTISNKTMTQDVMT